MMSFYDLKILHDGDEYGNSMIIREKLPSGREIFGLATKNFYGGEWDYGPTWNYLICSDKLYLVDTGRFGCGKMLADMLESIGINLSDIDSIFISHGHEDHDGGLYELVNRSGAKVRTHRFYDRLIRYYPGNVPPDAREGYPASCWHCFLPESFAEKNCLEYHRQRNELTIETIPDAKSTIAPGLVSYHLPGHSPDAISLLINGEALLLGDNILPDITPFPSQEKFYLQVEGVLADGAPPAINPYGLATYLKSLKKLKEIAGLNQGVVSLPAHRLYYQHKWADSSVIDTVDELIAHHIQRCSAILEIIKSAAKDDEAIAKKYFRPSQLTGYGIIMAKNEVASHCELMMQAGDLVLQPNGLYEASGSTKFESLIESLKPYY